MENVLEQTKIPATPQDYLNNAVFLLNGGNGSLASEAAWNCGSLQLSNFLLCHQLDAKHDELKERIVRFLENSFTDRILWQCFYATWSTLEEGYENYFEDDCTLDEVKEILEYAEDFCNILYNIYMENSLSPVMISSMVFLHL
ncbi:unnamed protein product [Meloidogyne enterolobii]|uniref:Uncharacterized protein n=1 Tax=Meloidogyne enterolobii TaxID=390850 RepID=A0ACB0ZHX1_MELEN